MDILLLRFDAPLMSFGGVMVDQEGQTDRFPGLSLITGLCANALGLAHKDTDKLDGLQGRIEYAARWDVPPEPFLDYQTVDLGQEKMSHPGWTTRGTPEYRAGGAAARLGTHQRYRRYWANGVMTLALCLHGDESPTLDALEAAFRRPTRPLFLGRKTCLPAEPLLAGRTESADVLSALIRLPAVTRNIRQQESHPRLMEACWPLRLGLKEHSRAVPVYDQRDWKKQVPAGRRVRVQGLLVCEETP